MWRINARLKNLQQFLFYIVVIEFSTNRTKKTVFNVASIFVKCSNFRCQLLSKMLTERSKSFGLQRWKSACTCTERGLYLSIPITLKLFGIFYYVWKITTLKTLLLRFGEQLNLNNFCRFNACALPCFSLILGKKDYCDEHGYTSYFRQTSRKIYTNESFN